MMTKVSWQEKFQSAVKNAENLYSKDSTSGSLLLYCLRSKLISAQEYLNWAKENYQLPVLSEKYLQIHQPQKEFYKIWQKIYNWSAECLPIAEWDGALIIACLEVPTKYQNTNPTIFVLASHEVLEKVWAVYSKSEKTSLLAATTAAIAATIPTDATDMSALSATIEAPAPNSESFFGEDGQIVLQGDASDESEESTELPEEGSSKEEGEEGESSEHAEEEASGSPEGLFMGDSSAAPPALGGFSKASLLMPKEDATAPAEENAVVLEAKSEKASPVMESEVEEAPIKKGPRTSSPVMNMEVLGVGDRTKIDTSMDDLEEIPDHEVPMPGKKAISPMNHAPVGDLPQAPVKATAPTSGSAAYLLEKIRKQSQAVFDREALASFLRLKTFFKKSMILAVGDKDRLVKPIIWDENFESPKPQTTAEFNLKTPSIFKIVNGTQKPYHGFVTVNDLNESFFESWNHGQIPDHVTIVPLMDGDLVVGMLMGFGEKSSYNKNVLQFTEGVAKDLSQKILKQAAPKAVA